MNFNPTVYLGIKTTDYFEMKIARSLLEIVEKPILAIRK